MNGIKTKQVYGVIHSIEKYNDRINIRVWLDGRMKFLDFENLYNIDVNKSILGNKIEITENSMDVGNVHVTIQKAILIFESKTHEHVAVDVEVTTDSDNVGETRWYKVRSDGSLEDL